MASKSTFNRREFLGVAAAASTITVLPRRVLGGPGYVAPSDKINMALIGSGTMGLNMLMSDWLPSEDLHISCVCDPNKDSTDYRDWGNNRIYQMRRFVDQPNWGDPNAGIRAGRDVGKWLIESYYANNRESGTYTGCKTYADYRELLEAEEDIDGVIIMTPEHLHGPIAIAAMNKGKHAVTHKTLANTLHEVRKVVETAERQGVVTHMMAWHNQLWMYRIKDWIDAGVIGTVREVHNWSRRPVWPQGWADYLPSQPMPDGLDWNLWLGTVPHLPYNLNYTHALFRGWYDFGSGCLGDMGNYSLWQVYRILGLGVPTVIEGSPSSDARVVDSISGPFRTQVAFPHASTIRFMHPGSGGRAPLSIFWYDGGIKPITPDELYADGEELQDEGMLIVGDDGKILAEFLGENPRLIPRARHDAFQGSITTEPEDLTTAPEEWIRAIKNGSSSRGSFEEAAAIAEATCLGNIAIRMNRRLVWDAEDMVIVNIPEANKHLKREYRPGWDV